MDNLRLEVSHRQVTGKKVKQLRRQGVTPVHLFGKDISSLSLQAETKTLTRLVIQAGKNNPVSLAIEGQAEESFTFIREVQKHPLTARIVHVDFQLVISTELTISLVPVVLIGEAPAVRVNGGTLSYLLHEISVESLPMNVPQVIEADISGLDDFDKVIRVENLPIGPDVTIVNDPEQAVARVMAPRVATETAGIEAGEVGGEPTAEAKEPGAEEGEQQ